MIERAVGCLERFFISFHHFGAAGMYDERADVLKRQVVFGQKGSQVDTGMLADDPRDSLGKNNLQAPWLGITAFFVIATMLSLLIFIGEAVRDAFDPRKMPGGEA